MIIKSVDGQLGSTSFFKPVAIGFILGAAVFFVPMLLLMALMGIVTVATGDAGGPEAGGTSPLSHIMLGFVMVPLILVMQSVMFGGLVVLGLSIYRIKRPILVSNYTQSAVEIPSTPPPSPQSTG